MVWIGLWGWRRKGWGKGCKDGWKCVCVCVTMTVGGAVVVDLV